MKAKSGMKHAGAGMRNERKEAGMAHEKRPETVTQEMKERFHAAVQGKVYQPKQKK